MDLKFKLLGRPEEQPTRFAEIKLATAKHRRQGKETRLYHVFVNMNPHSKSTTTFAAGGQKPF